jgi:hypothetical protein
LTEQLAEYPGVVAVAEPTSMSWLPLAAAVDEAGGTLALLGPDMRPGYVGRSPARTSPM